MRFSFLRLLASPSQTVSPPVLQQANASLRLGQNAAFIGGSAVAGFLVATIGSGWSLAIDAATFALGALFLSRIRLPRGDRIVGGSALRELREGWTEFRARTWVWVIVVQFTFVNLALACAFTTLGPVIADDTVGRRVWGLVLASQAIGLILGGLLALRVRPPRPLRFGVAFSVLIALLGALAFAPQALPLVLCAVAAGIGIEVFSVTWDLSLQQHIPSDRLSRVASYDVLGSFVFIPVGYVAAGPCRPPSASLRPSPAAPSWPSRARWAHCSSAMFVICGGPMSMQRRLERRRCRRGDTHALFTLAVRRRRPGRSPTRRRTERIYGEHLAFVDRLREDGTYVTSGPLDAQAATQLRRDDSGAVLVTDTPLPETREVLGSFYLVEVADEAAARALATAIPASPGLVTTIPVVPI